MSTPRILGSFSALLLSLVLLASAGPVRAQNIAVPAFEFAKPPEKPAVEWKVQAKGGFLLTSGNTETGGGTLGLDSSRKSGQNKLSLNGDLSYGRSRILTATVVDGVTSQIGRESQTTSNEWHTRGRYDRFFTPNNAAYAVALLASDKVAGKKLMGGGQVGYSRQLLKNEQHTLVAEAGYDLSFESYVAAPDTVTIQSARLFVGELFTLSKETGLSGSIEALFNLNKETALNANDETGHTKGVDAFKDTRIVGKLGLTTTLRKSLSLALGFTLRYDQNPAPWPHIGDAPYVPNFVPFGDKVDTRTEATLIYTFL